MSRKFCNFEVLTIKYKTLCSATKVQTFFQRSTSFSKKMMPREKDIRQRPITIDWMLRLGIMGVPLYLKYSGDNVLKDGGVKFRSLSFGLYL